MRDMAKKAVILNNFSSPYISEAIIIIKDCGVEAESRAVREAEKIVSDYIRAHSKGGQLSSKPVRPKKRKFFLAALFLIAAAAAFAVCRIMTG